MSKKTRLIIVIFCVISFFIIAPVLVAYSMGYRYDFDQKEVVATGGIYVRTFPTADKITVGAQAPQKPSMFGNSVFVQNLLPKQHSVLIEKAGYTTYKKTVGVSEKEVTKLENIILFKDNIVYQKLLDSAESFYISPDKRNILADGLNTKKLDLYYLAVSNPDSPQKYSLDLAYTSVLDVKWSDDSNKALLKTQNATDGIAYYLLDVTTKTAPSSALSYLDSKSISITFNPQDSNQIFYIKNKTLYSIKNNLQSVVAKNVVSYNFLSGNIVWLSADGQLQQSDTSGKNVKVLASWPVNKDYLSPENAKIEIVSGKIIVLSQGYAYEYSQEEKNLKQSTLGSEIENFKILASPDNKNIIYYNNSKIYLYIPTDLNAKIGNVQLNSVLLFEENSANIISECFWLNNDYIIFQVGNKIMTAEIDYRGNINTAEITQTYPAGPESKTPKMIYNQNDSKVYILSNKILYSSEKLVP